jgi:hypothetical protein
MPVQIQTYRPTLNAGQTYLKNVAIAGPKVAVGNVSQLQLAISEEEKSLADYTQPGGGQWAALSRVTGIEASLTLHDLDPVNLARGLYGDASAEGAGTVAAETGIAYQGGLFGLEYPSPTSVVVTSGAGAWAGSTAVAEGTFIDDGTNLQECTTAGTTDSTEPTWGLIVGGTVTDGTAVWTNRGPFAAVADTDYEVRGAGLMIMDGGIPDGCPISVAYSYGAHQIVQALTSGSGIYELTFDGVNEADSNSPSILDIYRLQIGATASLPFLSDDFASLEVKGKVLLDSTKTGVGISKYFRVRMR